MELVIAHWQIRIARLTTDPARQPRLRSRALAAHMAGRQRRAVAAACEQAYRRLLLRQ